MYGYTQELQHCNALELSFEKQILKLSIFLYGQHLPELQNKYT